MPTSERVYTVIDYWDGPRQGVADFNGRPHLYRSVWRSDIDDWDPDRYFLFPISAEQAALAVEDWSIWRRFHEDYRGRAVPAIHDPADWGALPEDTTRHRELQQLLAPLLKVRAEDAMVARAEFKSRSTPVEGS